MSLEIRERHFSSFFEVPFAVYGERYPFVPMLYGDLKDMLDPAGNKPDPKKLRLAGPVTGG